MMTMSEFENATPRPWATNCHHVPARVESEAEHGIVNDGWIICDCDGPDGEANAELIVRAVNAHDDLVAALDMCLDLIRDMSRYRHAEEMALKNYALFNEAPIKASAALAKARGEQ
jgi:hypothetical protein